MGSPISFKVPVPRRGLGLDFSESERPITFARRLRNRFINKNASAERREGMSIAFPLVTGGPTLTEAHEHVSETGVETLLVSNNDGDIWKFNTTTSAWTQNRTGEGNGRLNSVQMGNKLIFFDGVSRNLFTDDGGETFSELEAIISRGDTGTGTGTTTLKDASITDWLTETQIAENDIVFNVDVSAFGVVTAVSGAEVTHTTIASQDSGDVYKVIDMVALNIIPKANGFDNISLAGADTTTTVVSVTGLDMSTTQIRVGDYIRNTTRSGVGKVTSVSSNVNISPSIASQTEGDSVVFLKSSMPIATRGTVHFERLYMIDAREQDKVRISGPNDPEDMTTFAKTLDTSTYDFGAANSEGDTLLTLGSFQQYFVAAGKQNVYLFSGTDPIADTTAAAVTFAPIGAFPQGCVTQFGLLSNGNDLLFVSPDGLQASNVGSDSSNIVGKNISDPVKNTLRRKIAANSSNDIRVWFYRKRNWVMLKIGSEIFNFNLSTIFDDLGNEVRNGSWSLFDGAYASQNSYKVRRNGDLIAVGNQGQVFRLDDGTFSDAGDTISTEFETSWLRLEEPNNTIREKKGTFIKPVFESAGGVVYNIEGVAGFDGLTTATAQVTAEGQGTIGSYTIGTDPIGGTGIQTQKIGFIWQGEEVRVKYTTDTSAGPDVITGFTMYGEILGAV